MSPRPDSTPSGPPLTQPTIPKTAKLEDDEAPVIHRIRERRFHLSWPASIEHMFVQESAMRRCSFPAAADRTVQKGGAATITNSKDAGDRCNHCLPDLEVTPRAAPSAAGTLLSTEDSARRTLTRGRRASRYVPFGPSTARRVPADLMAAPNRVRPEAFAQATPSSTTVAAGWRRCSKLRWDATFLAARNAIFALGYRQGHWRQLRLKRPLTPLRERTGRILKLG
jgi:hypothetical protein